VLCKPGSVTPHTKFEAEAYILTKEEGGRHTPFFANYRPQFYFRTTDVTGTVELAAGTEMVMPGDNVSFTVELIAPIAMEDGLRFAIREGGRTVGAGVVSSCRKSSSDLRRPADFLQEIWTENCSFPVPKRNRGVARFGGPLFLFVASWSRHAPLPSAAG
jgi:hypothetical protein